MFQISEKMINKINIAVADLYGVKRNALTVLTIKSYMLYAKRIF